MRYELSDTAKADLQYWKSHDSKIFKRIFQILENIAQTPFSGIGKPKPLKSSLSGYWSRRITREHRIVYKIKNNTISIISCRYHYEK